MAVDLAPEVRRHLEARLASLLAERDGRPATELAALLVRGTYLVDLPVIEVPAHVFRDQVLAWVLDRAGAGLGVELRAGRVHLNGRVGSTPPE